MKKFLEIAVDILAWVVLICAFLITLIVFSSERNNGVPTLLGFMPMSVETDSMVPTFGSGDLIIVKQIDDLYSLKEDDVITFYTIIEGKRVKNTHRITEVVVSGNSRSFKTKGDANILADEDPVTSSDIIGRWTGIRVPKMGSVLSFMRTKTGFFVCILIPLAIFFLFELYKFIAVLLETKKPKITAEAEEEIRRKAVEEYLAQQAAQKGEASGEEASKAVEAVKEEVKEEAAKVSESVAEETAKVSEAVAEEVSKATETASEE